jgi:hypothetical protein
MQKLAGLGACFIYLLYKITYFLCLIYVVQETYNSINFNLFCPGALHLNKTNLGMLMYTPNTTSHSSIQRIREAASIKLAKYATERRSVGMIAELSMLSAGHGTTEAQFSARHPENPRSLTYVVQETYNFINCILFCPGALLLKKTNSGKVMYTPNTTCHSSIEPIREAASIKLAKYATE